MQQVNVNEGEIKTISIYGGRKARQRLQVLIVGAGIGGLGAAYTLGQAGHAVTVVESSPSIGELGAGIQVGPNLSRIFFKWGLEDTLQRFARDKPNWFTFRRYNTGERIGMSRLEGKLEHDHGAPWFVVHRAQLYDMLFSLAAPFMELRMNSKVVQVNIQDQDGPSVTLQTGEILSADLIIGADGINSTVRHCVTGRKEMPLANPLGDVAYRAVIPTDTFTNDSELKALTEEPEITCWIGPHKHAVGYCVRDRKEYNMVFVTPGNASAYSWTAKADPDELRTNFVGWDPCVQKLLSRASTVLKSQLLICEPLKTWIDRTGRVALLGDSCHPMLPYRAQGAAMSIEDAALLGELFSRISTRSQIPELLKAYEDLRHSRTTATQAASALNKEVYHLPDGPEQQKRDASMRLAMKEELLQYGGCLDELCLERGSLAYSYSSHGNPNAWADKSKNQEQFDYKPELEVDAWWAANGTRIIGTGAKL